MSDLQSTLGFALLGLLRARPRSGYDLHRLFVETPVGRFSGSPGAIYPALRRLRERKLVAGSIEAPARVRRREVFRVTRRGESTLRGWLQEDIREGDIARRLDVLMLRFTFMEGLCEPAEILVFLAQFQTRVDAYLVRLRRYRDEQLDPSSLHTTLALDHGIEGYAAQSRWIRKARRSLAHRKGPAS
jgi:DNA-binding PadR family transcriptional regulator